MRQSRSCFNKLFPKYKDSAVNYLRCARMRILCGRFLRGTRNVGWAGWKREKGRVLILFKHSNIQTFNLKTAVGPRCFKHRGTETRRKGDFLSYMFTYDFSFSHAPISQMGENQNNRLSSILTKISVPLCLCVKISRRRQA